MAAAEDAFISGSKSTLVKEINVKTKENKWTCTISGIVELAPGTLIICDHTGDTGFVKIIDTEKEQVDFVLELTPSPWDVTLLPEHQQVAVTQPDDRSIQYLSITGRELSKERKVNVDGTCCGIVYSRGYLVVSFDYPLPAVRILDLDGTVIHNYLTGDIKLSRSPYYVAVSKDGQYMFLSDMYNKRVIKFIWLGKMIDELILEEYMDFPLGVVTCTDGRLYICSDEIHLVSPDCKMLGTVLSEEHGIRVPAALCCCSDGLLYVSCHNKDGKYANVVRGYNIVLEELN